MIMPLSFCPCAYFCIELTVQYQEVKVGKDVACGTGLLLNLFSAEPILHFFQFLSDPPTH